MTLTYILVGVVVIQSTIHHFERKDLYNRIMSRSLSDYKDESKKGKSAHVRRLEEWRKRGDVR